VEVRAVRRRVPSLESGLPESTTRRETPAYELLNPFAQGQLGGLLNVSPDFVITGPGQFSLLGGPASSNQLTLGGVRMPAGMVIGEQRGRVATSPWDVSVGGAAGATVAIEQTPGSRFGSTSAIVRGGASGVTGGGAAAPAGITRPVQATLSSSGARGRFGYSTSLFSARTTVSLPRWSESLQPRTRTVLDSLGALAGTALIQADETTLQYGAITRLDLLAREEQGASRREPTSAQSLTIALTGTSQDGGIRGQFAAGSAATRAQTDVGVLQFDAHRIVARRYRIANTLSATTTGMRLARRSTGPAIQVTDSAFGAVLSAGAAAPVPGSRTTAVELRSQATWFSATNVRRYLVQVQGRHEGMSVDGLDPQSSFLVASPLDLQQGRAVAMARTESAPSARATTVIVAPAASIGIDLGGRGALLFGLRADGWRAMDVIPSRVLQGVALQPRFGFQHALGRRANGRGNWATLRGGAGRFADWPTPGGWAPAWSSNGGGITTCTGAGVAAIDISEPAAVCRSDADIVSPGRLAAATTLRPVTSTRGELTLSINKLVRQLRADVGVTASRFDDVETIFSAHTDGAIRSRLGGDGGRATLVDATAIGADGVVPRAPLPAPAAAPMLASAGRREGIQYRVRLATRDPWARTQLEANYAWNDGRQRAVLIAPPFGSPGVVTAPASGNRHTIAASLGTWLGLAQIRATIIARSGVRFTPTADRDLNGDGVANDAAFVPAAFAASWAAQVPTSLRGCIGGAAGRLFTPNECSGPWSLGSNVFAQMPGRYLGLPRSTEVHLQISNPTSLLAGLGGTGGVNFGTSAFVDPRLTTITGYDATAQRFDAQLLRGFGRPVGLSRTITDPAAIAVSVRIPLGRSSFAKRIDSAMDLLAGDTTAVTRERAAAEVINQLPNVPEVFLAQIRAIRLSEQQRAIVDSLRVAWDEVTPRALATIAPRSGSDAVARAALLVARAHAVARLLEIVTRLKTVLTPGQLAQLEPSEAALLNLRVFRWAEVSAYPL